MVFSVVEIIVIETKKKSYDSWTITFELFGSFWFISEARRPKSHLA